MSLTPSRRRALLALTCAAAAVAVTACGSDDAGGDGDPSAAGTGPVTVELVHPGLPYVVTSLEETLGAEFTERTGITVNLVRTAESYSDVDQRITSDIAAGSPPDLALVGLGNLRLYADEGVARPLDDLMAADDEFDPGQFSPAILDLTEYDDTTYGMPYVTSSLILYINADVFRAAGLDPDDPPLTYSELADAATAIVDSGAAPNGITFNADSDNWRLQNLLVSGGASFMTEDESDLAFDSPEALDVLRYWADLAAGGGMVLLPAGDNVDAFRRGDVGMILHSSANLQTIGDGVDFDVRTSPAPIPDDGTRHLPPAGSTLMLLTDDPAQEAAAWQVIKELTGPEGSTTVTTNSGYVPLNRVAIETPELLGDLLAADPRRRPAIDQSTDYVRWFQFPGLDAVEINAILAEEFEALVRGDKTPEAAMADARARIEPLLP